MQQICLSDVLVVPEMKPKLFSCGAGYVQDGLSTELNGQCCLVADDGQRFPFNDNPRHYSIYTYGNVKSTADGDIDTVRLARAQRPPLAW